MKAVSLFSGAGGCSYGFKLEDVEIIAAYDNDKDCINTYRKNIAGASCSLLDLSACDFREMRDSLGLQLGQLDLVFGGPPCQGFTTAGLRVWDDQRNNLIRSYADALEAFAPRWFLMENVEGILTTSGGSFIFEFLKRIGLLGYSIFLKKVYMQEYGIPQRRKRVLIIGNREGKIFSFPPVQAAAQGTIFRNSPITLQQAIGDLEEKEVPEIDHVWRQESGIQSKRIEALQVGQTMKDLPLALQHDSFKRRANRRVCDGTAMEKRGGAPRGLKRLSYSEPCLTITSCSNSEFIHPVQNRFLTIRECARIQTFPDSFLFCGSERQKMAQIGNAIPPLFAQQIARSIKKCDLNAPFAYPAGLIEYEVTKAKQMSPKLARTCTLFEILRSNSS